MNDLLLRVLVRGYFPFVITLCVLSLAGAAWLVLLMLSEGAWYLAVPAFFLGMAGLHLLWVFYFVLTFNPPKDFWEMKFPRARLAALYELVDGVAKDWDLEPPEEIRLGAGTVAHVYETAKGKRILVIGGVAVAAFSQEALAGIVAHELAHITSGDTTLSRYIFTRRLTMEAYKYMCHQHKISYLNPLVWIAEIYYFAFRLSDARQSRQQEDAADQYSVKQAGEETTATVLVYAHVTEHLRWAKLEKIVTAAVRTEQVMVPIFTQQVGQARATSLDEWEKALKKAVGERTKLLDTHPCLAERLAAIGIKPKKALKIALEHRGTPASELIPGWDEIEKDLSERLMEPFRERRQALLEAHAIMKALDRGAGY